MKPKDRDFIETLEGFLFCVVGYLHPSDRYTAYLKYVPSKNGKWSIGETRYSRTMQYYDVSQVENIYNYLKQNYLEYVFNCPVMNIKISSVPHMKVRKYYDPKERVKKLLEEGASDHLEQKLLEWVNLIEDRTKGKISIGITGSILIKTHNPEFSDIDITVYGKRQSMKVKETLFQLMLEGIDARACSRVDLMRSEEDGTLYTIEVNSTPSWEGLQKVTSIDIAERLDEYILERIR